MGSHNANASDRPNILLIMTDQHRWDLMSCEGPTIVPTPNMDRIAQAGVRFRNAYCPYPVCVGSRMAMLTGLYAHHNGAINNGDHLDWRWRTMAHHFAARGYLTGLIGKMHFGDACKHGFEYSLSVNDWLMYLGPKAQHYADEVANNPHAPVFFDNVFDTGTSFPDVDNLWDGKSPWVGNVERYDFKRMPTMASRLAAEDHLDMFVTRESAKFLQRYREQPFFLIASLMKPHTPLFAPAEWAERYPIDQMPVPAVPDVSQYPQHLHVRMTGTMRQNPRLWQANLAGYYAGLAFADHCIGQLYDALEKQGLLKNTIVVYTSDHGDMLGTHGLQGKFCLFEGSVKVPLIVSHPQTLPEGKVSEALVELLGLYPALADLSGTGPVGPPAITPLPNAPSRIDGPSFAECVRAPAQAGPEAGFSEYDLKGRVPQYMIRTRQYKYIHNAGGSGDELYDLGKDPQERVNRIGDAALAETRADLRRRLFAWYDPTRSPWKA